MRVLIVFHGRLPGGPYPVPGIALRAFCHGQGLTAAGLEVCYATRTRDLQGPPVPGLPPMHGFEGRAELMALVRALRPDTILALGTDELYALHDVSLPLVLDLFAPRVLESQWEQLDPAREILTLLDGLARADYFITTTPLHRAYILGLLPLAGVDCREDRLLTVPLSVPTPLPTRARGPLPLLVSGGVAWPWLDPRWGLNQVAGWLKAKGQGQLRLLRGPYPLAGVPAPQPTSERDKKGEGRQHRSAARAEAKLLAQSQVVTGPVGALPILLPEGAPVTEQGLLPYPAMLELYASAWASVDIMAPNLEREQALSFRQLDALACGLPLILADHVPLAQRVAEYQAGWTVRFGDENGLAAALEACFDPAENARRGENAQRLAREVFLCTDTVKPLVEVLRRPTRRRGSQTVMAMAARQAAEAKEQADALERLTRDLASVAADREKKDLEVRVLDERVRELLRGQGKLTSALEAALHLGADRVAGEEAARTELADTLLARERDVALLRRDGAKKDRELTRLEAVKEGLEADVAELQALQAEVSARAEGLAAEVAGLRGRLQRTEEALRAKEAEAEALRQDRDKKAAELAELWKLRDGLNAAEEARARRLGVEELIPLVEGVKLALEPVAEARAGFEGLGDRLLGRLAGLEEEIDRLRVEVARREKTLQEVSRAGVVGNLRAAIGRELAARKKG